MKPMIFSTEMVQAILRTKNPKSQTRRVMKPQLGPGPPEGQYRYDGVQEGIPAIELLDAAGNSTEEYFECGKPPCEVGDTLWVKEAWLKLDSCEGCGCDNEPEDQSGCYLYKATHVCDVLDTPWKSPRFMPRAAARIYLQVVDMWPERLQDISEEDAISGGALRANWTYDMPKDLQHKSPYIIGYAKIWDEINAKPKPVYVTINGKKTITHYESHPWEDVQETREYRGKSWIVRGNPWVWAISFERIDSP